jgi:hypothetical protein
MNDDIKVEKSSGNSLILELPIQKRRWRKQSLLAV